ncbi:LOW QUALITY PROTEIN: hypothetical protein ElyMa_004505100 [Elysia marginata]|uniref:Uncharacterized protein n=1 Tax=Elysia marginata TaxID=1093978 RepID=A0AAV4HLJ2_9GAST|nr:LOW QUALITY PROTEIN: hypothetical protein ElyMa_004505100 [Elysia marginata]
MRTRLRNQFYNNTGKKEGGRGLEPRTSRSKSRVSTRYATLCQTRRTPDLLFQKSSVYTLRYAVPNQDSNPGPFVPKVECLNATLRCAKPGLEPRTFRSKSRVSKRYATLCQTRTQTPDLLFQKSSVYTLGCAVPNQDSNPGPLVTNVKVYTLRCSMGNRVPVLKKSNGPILGRVGLTTLR